MERGGLMMITIERAVPEDAKRITEIKTVAFNQEINKYLGRNGGPCGYDKVESEMEIIHRFLAYKIMLKSEIIGAFFLILTGEKAIRLEDSVIHPVCQGKGYGFRTLQLMEEAYPDIEEWSLSTPVFSVGNQHLYEKFGYREIARNEEEIEYCKRI